jgi:cytosine deaminase
MNLIIRNAKLRGINEYLDISILGDNIAEVKKHISGKGNIEIDARKKLVLPSFSDMHLHLDSVLTLGTPRYNTSGTVLEGIDIWGEYKKSLSKEEMKKRASRALEWIASHGTTRVVTHADVTDPNLNTLKGLLELKEEISDIIDLKVTAFPQDGILTDPANMELLEKAAEMGADNIGIIPHAEYTREDGVKSVNIAFEIAKKYDKNVDGHIDETDDDQSRFLEVVIANTIRNDYQGRVTAGHTTAMHSYNNAYAHKLYSLLKKSEISIIPNPLSNINLMGRYDLYPKRRGMTRINELHQNKINVALGHDSIMDPWYPLGIGDMLQVLFMAVHVGQLTGYNELMECLDLITVNSAKALGIQNTYGISDGKIADLVVTNACDEIELIRTMGPRLFVLKEGRIISKVNRPSTKILRKKGESIIYFKK